MAETERMSTCPMSAMCSRMMNKPATGLWMVVPGLVFIALGVLIILYPQILAWFVAIALIVMGVGMLMMVNFMRGFGREFHERHG